MTPSELITLERHSFADDGTIPNNPRLRVLIYRGVTDVKDRARAFERLFEKNGWTNSWRGGLYDYDHFHSKAHEVLGVAEGSVTARLGGANGKTVTLKAGDVAVLTAGTGHMCERATGNLVIVGAYDRGRDWDICRGATQQSREVRQNIAAVPDPDRDPVTGASGTF